MVRLIFITFGFLTIFQPCCSQSGWKSIARLPSSRDQAVAFSIGSFGYVGTGNWGHVKDDFWRYDPTKDIWEEIASMPTGGRTGAFSFAIDGKGYVGGGLNDSLKRDWEFWEYDPEKNKWERKADIPTPNGDATATSFSIGHRGYLLSTYHKETFFEYDPYTDTWTTKAKFPGVARRHQVGFSIDNKGYIGTGYAGSDNGGTSSEFWEYDPINDLWTRKANVPGLPRIQGVGFGTNHRGYIGLGVAEGGIDLSDCWEYNPDLDKWKQIDDIEYHAWDAVGFSIRNIGYVGSGYSRTGKEFWKYTPETLSVGSIENKYLLNVYPNPVKELLQLKYSNHSLKSYSIFSLSGQRIKSGPLEGKSISVGGLPNGVYILTVRSNNYSINRIFVKTK